jgi:hypothetical protein
MKPYRFTSAASAELTEATLHYELRENGLGAVFLNEIEATLNRILNILPLGISCPHEPDAVELIDSIWSYLPDPSG